MMAAAIGVEAETVVAIGNEAIGSGDRLSGDRRFRQGIQ